MTAQRFFFENPETGSGVVIEALSVDHAWAIVLGGNDSLGARWNSPWWLARVWPDPEDDDDPDLD